MPSMTLQLRHLSCQRNGKTLISGLCLTFTVGRPYLILGPNGAGKSTLLKAIAGIWPCATGEVLWRGAELHRRQRHEVSRVVAYVPQQPPLSLAFTAEELVSMGLYVHQRRYQVGGAAVDEALQQVDMWEQRHRPLIQLSGGERQRVYIARALASNAPVILMDEPMSSLDIKHQLDIMALLRSLAQQRVVIAAHHDLASAASGGCELVLMNKGRCLRQGDGSLLRDAPLVEEVFGVAPLLERRETLSFRLPPAQDEGPKIVPLASGTG